MTGTATGGVEVFTVAESNTLHFYSYTAGELLYVIPGGLDSSGVAVGHTGVITCVCMDTEYVYSGSTDETVISWQLGTYEVSV